MENAWPHPSTSRIKLPLQAIEIDSAQAKEKFRLLIAQLSFLLLRRLHLQWQQATLVVGSGGGGAGGSSSAGGVGYDGQ